MYEKSYHSAVLKTEKKPEKRSKVNWKLVLGLFAVVAVIGGIVVLIKLPAWQVRNVEVEGAHVADPGDVREFVMAELQGKRLFFLPKTSILMVPEHRLEKGLKDHFSRFQTVEVDRKNFSTILVTVSEFQGVSLWCKDQDTCFFMDQNGIAFAKAPVFSGSAYPKVFVGEVQPLPFQALTMEQEKMVELLLERLPPIMINPTEFYFKGERKLEVVFNHGGNQAKLIFDPTVDMQKALNALFSGLRTNPLATKFHDSSKVLEYIDVRFSNRVVYKFAE